MDNTCPPDPEPPITDSEELLDVLTHRAELEFQSQPLPTQRSLTKQTRQIFDHYAKHGTASSLRSAITSYFKGDGLRDDSGIIFSPPLPPTFIPPPPDPNDSRMVDEESRDLVQGMPFRIDRKLHIRPNVKLPEGLFEGINRVFEIYQAEAEAMLRHHCEKYGDEAIFRVGIRSLFLSRSETLLQSTTSHSFGLDPETRLFLLQVYERHPSLNLAEKRVLARFARVNTDVVEAFWKSLSTMRVPYMAMRTVIAARELRRQHQYRDQLQQLHEATRLTMEQQRRQEEQEKRDEMIRRRMQQQQLIASSTLYHPWRQM